MALILSYQFAYCACELLTVDEEVLAEAVEVVVELLDVEEVLFSLLSVFSPATPSAVSLLAFWKAATAAAVLVP
jgi:hypothetical protein